EYLIPADIEAYQEHDDHYLMKFLRKSDNKYAKSIVQNEIPQKIYESFNQSQLNQLENIQKYLEQEGIEYIRSSSKGRLSKYYQGQSVETSFSLKVIRKTATGKARVTNIDEATDLYKKFSTSHAVNRLHCDLASATEIQKIKIWEMIAE